MQVAHNELHKAHFLPADTSPYYPSGHTFKQYPIALLYSKNLGELQDIH